VRLRVGALVVGAALIAACDNGNGPPPPQASIFRALHAIRGGPTLNVVVDQRSLATALAFGELTRALALSPGPHTLEPVPSNSGLHVFLVFNTVSGVNYTAFVMDSVSGSDHIVDPVVVSDTGSQPAPGHGRLRLGNFAAVAGSIDAYRTQPDSSGLILTRRPFNFRAVTGYFESTPGKWTVVISHGGVMDTLLATDSILVGDGQARTVALVDSGPGLVSWRLVPDRN